MNLSFLAIRFFDIFFSLIGLIFLFPIFLIVSIILFFTGPKKIFFKQKRIGKNGKEFEIIKFTTMYNNSKNDITVDGDKNIFKFGTFLRKTKINELPQLINILKGDMSVIGYRPQTKNSYECYDEKTKKILEKYPPGLSGIGSIIFRNEEEFLKKVKDPYEFYINYICKYKGYIEEWYYKNLNLKNYFLLIIFTIIVIFNKKSNFIFEKYPELKKDLPKELEKIFY